jgi:uncharacterized metal-binding protein YceD (DUF177 family)
MSEPFSHVVAAAAIPAAGRHFRIEADAAARRRLAKALGIVDVVSLAAELDLLLARGGAISVRGKVTATVVQADVVTLEPVTQDVVEDVDLMLVPAEGAAPEPVEKELTAESEGPDLYYGGRIDLGAIAAEHLALGLDPYPRAPGVEFPGHVEDNARRSSPFASLEALKRRGG